MKPLTITQNDLVNVCRRHLAQRIKKKKKLFTIVELVLLALACIFLVIGKQNTVTLMFAIVLAFTFPLAMGIYWLFKLPRTAKRDYKRANLYPQSQTIHWDAQTLYANNGQEDSQVAWNTFIEMVQDSGYVLLYTHNRIIHIFPKRFFESEAELNQFIQYAQNGISENQKNSEN